MRFLYDISRLAVECPSVVTIGKFDGFHRGHQALLSQASADRRGDEQLVLLTFSRSPQMVLSGRYGTSLLTRQEKLAMAESLGVDLLVELPFSDELRRMSAEAFLRDVLLDRLKAREIIAGPDCRFGYARRGDADFLRARSQQDGFRLHIVEKEQYRGEPISSSRVRQALSEGKAEEAAEMLGYPFGFRSVISHGKQLGRRLGFPTINQEISTEKALPAFGVYAVEVCLGERKLAGVANVGIRPTVSAGSAACVETSIYDFDEDLYGQEVQVNLIHFVRPEQRFRNIEELKDQISLDVLKVRQYWEMYSPGIIRTSKEE